MKNTIKAIYLASGKEYPTDADTLKAIDFLSELIEENHFLDEPEPFGFKAFDFNDYHTICDTEIEAQAEYINDVQEAKQDWHEDNKSTYSDLFDAIDELSIKLSSEDDFTFDYDGNEYRVISESAIWDIYVDTIKDTVTDCYDLNLDNIPSFVAIEIDWEKTAKNCYSDGYGHTFSGYDGSELEINDFYVFRTN